MSVPHTYSLIGAIMNSMGGGADGGGAQIVSVVPDDFALTEGNDTLVNVTTSGFPDGTTELSWEVRNSSNQVATADWAVASGTVDINVGAFSTTYVEVDGAIVDISKETGDDIYTYNFSGTLSGSGIGFGWPLIPNQQIGQSSYYRGASTGVSGQYAVNERVLQGGNGTASFTIQSENDSVTEGDEQFTVRCSATVDSAAITQSSSPITVSDPSGLQDFGIGLPIARWFKFPGQPDRTGSDIAILCRSNAASTGGELVIARTEVKITIKAAYYNDAPGEGGTPRKQLKVVGNALRAENQAVWYNNTQNAAAPLQVNAGANGDQTLYYNSSGKGRPSHVKLIYGRYGVSGQVDTGWVPTPNYEDGVSVTLVGQAEADVAADEFDNGKYVVECWAKQEGLYAATNVVTLIVACEAYAAGGDIFEDPGNG